MTQLSSRSHDPHSQSAHSHSCTCVAFRVRFPLLKDMPRVCSVCRDDLCSQLEAVLPDWELWSPVELTFVLVVISNDPNLTLVDPQVRRTNLLRLTEHLRRAPTGRPSVIHREGHVCDPNTFGVPALRPPSPSELRSGRQKGAGSIPFIGYALETDI